MKLNYQTFQSGLGVLKWLSEADQPTWTIRENEALAEIGEVFHLTISPDDITSLPAVLVPGTFKDEAERYNLLQVAVLFSLINGGISLAKCERVCELAKSLGIVKCRNLKILSLLAHGHTLRLRMTLMPHFWAVRKLKERLRTDGPGAVLTFFRANFRKTYVNDGLAAKYRRLVTYPDGTLGKEYARYIERNHFAFPGEKGAASEIITYHDMVHVLSGYDTTPLGEVQAASFMAGFMQRDDFNILMFVVLQFHLGIQVTPGAKPETGYCRLKPMLLAFARAATMNVDLTKDWDYWDVIEEPVTTLQARFGILSTQEVEARLSIDEVPMTKSSQARLGLRDPAGQ